MSQLQQHIVKKPASTETALEMQSESQIGHDDRARPGKQKREAKRKRWEAKQARHKEQKNIDEKRETWIRNHAHCCTKISLEDVERIKAASESDSSVLASLLRPYIDLKDGPERLESSEGDTLFIAEGTETVRLLIQQTAKDEALTVKSIFVKPATLFDPPVKLMTDITKVSKTDSSRKRTRSDGLNEAAKQISDSEQRRPPCHILVGAEEAMSAVAGFHISRGALACGAVPKRDESWLNRLISHRDSTKSLRLLAMDGISDSANMGSMIRCAAAFGVDAIILSSDCCDAWYRRSVRVSMGYIFHVPVVRVDDLASTLRGLAKSASCVSFAAVIDRDANLVLEDMDRGEVPRSWCCVMGNEGNGISSPVVKACSHRLRIQMSEGVDSLSVPIATAILLHGLKEREIVTLNRC